jgi:predicted Zn-dependent protease
MNSRTLRIAGNFVAAMLMALGVAGSVPGQTTTTKSVPAPGDSLRSIRQDINNGHVDQALQQSAQLRSAGQTTTGLYRMEGLALYAKGELISADKAFASALIEDPADLESAQMRGLTLFRLGRPAEAIPLLKSSHGASPGKADPNYVLALCYMDTRQYDEARIALAAQYGFEPDSAPAYLVAARMLLRREYLPISQQFAERALALDPKLPLVHELLGEIALAGNHIETAIAELENERSHNPLEGLVYERLGDAYVRAVRYDDAQRILQQAILLEPNTTGPYILLGKALLKKSDSLGAATYLERAEQLDPANYMTHSLLSQAYRSMGRQEDAAREIETAQKLQATNEPKLQNVH